MLTGLAVIVTIERGVTTFNAAEDSLRADAAYETAESERVDAHEAWHAAETAKSSRKRWNILKTQRWYGPGATASFAALALLFYVLRRRAALDEDESTPASGEPVDLPRGAVQESAARPSHVHNLTEQFGDREH